MKRTVWIGSVVAAIALSGAVAFLVLNGKAKVASPAWVGAATADAGSKPGVHTWKCLSDDAIDPAVRREIETTALAFAETFARSPAEARAEMSERGKAETTNARSVESASASYRNQETISARSVSETYLVTTQGGAGASGLIPCGEDEAADSQRFVMRGATPLNAVVLLDDDLVSGDGRTTTVWLENENNIWRTRGLHFGTTRIASFDGRAFWQMARAQRVLGNELNAYLLYAVAGQIVGGGAIYQPAYVQGYRTDAVKVRAPSPMQGAPPYEWVFDGRTFDLDDVRISSQSPGYLKLTLQHSTPFKSREQGAVINRQLIEGFDKAYPSWKDSFKVLTVRATKPWNDEIVEAELDRDGSYRQR